MVVKHGYVVLLGLGLALAACDSADDGVPSGGGGAGGSAGGGAGGSVAGGGAGGSAGGGAGASPSPAGCPATRTGDTVLWARDRATGECCAYAPAYAPEPPQAGGSFSTQAECQSQCRCATLEDFDETLGRYDTEKTSLECRCGSGGCPTSVDEAIAALCSPGRYVRRVEGCGLTFIVANDGFTSQGWLFEPGQAGDAGSSAASLVGAVEVSDVPFTPCETYVSVAGRDLDCEDTIECPVCGDPSEEIPAGCE
jgi:hypothetical protein